MRSDVPVRTPPRDAGGETEWIGCRLTAHANSELAQLAHFAARTPGVPWSSLEFFGPKREIGLGTSIFMFLKFRAL